MGPLAGYGVGSVVFIFAAGAVGVVSMSVPWAAFLMPVPAAAAVALLLGLLAHTADEPKGWRQW